MHQLYSLLKPNLKITIKGHLKHVPTGMNKKGDNCRKKLFFEHCKANK